MVSIKAQLSLVFSRKHFRLMLAALPAALPVLYAIESNPLVIPIAAATLVSEDLASIGAGVLAAQGRIHLWQAVFASFLGIFIGDLLLFLAGRFFGRAAIGRIPLKWFVRAADVERASEWFSRRGAAVIFISRFVPGMRLPTYFAAGLLKTGFGWFALYFCLAAAIWTPLLVGLSKTFGAEAIRSALAANRNIFLSVLFTVAAVYLIARLAPSLATWRGRRMLVSYSRKITRWEFWPAWMFYPPVMAYIAYLALKYRSLTLFTAANPAIVGGGFTGESKIAILQGLSPAKELLAHSAVIERSSDRESRLRFAKTFMMDSGFGFPIVLKPNQGQRGQGVAIVRSDREMIEYLSRAETDTIIQEYAPGEEFGVFYYRIPGEARGRIFSITEKRMPVLIGDGIKTLEQLILSDQRAVCMARVYLEKQKARIWEVPKSGEGVQLVELGTHCRGAIFLDGGWIKTEALEEAFDRISRGFEGFCFGRYDVRTPSIADFREGKNFKIVELNGVTSEAAHIYDPKYSLFKAYKTLFQQWRIAFEIGAENRRRGAQPASLRELLSLLNAPSATSYKIVSA